MRLRAAASSCIAVATASSRPVMAASAASHSGRLTTGGRAKGIDRVVYPSVARPKRPGSPLTVHGKTARWRGVFIRTPHSRARRFASVRSTPMRQIWRHLFARRGDPGRRLCGVEGGHEGSSDQVVEVTFDECLEGVEHAGLVGFGSPQHDRHRRVQGSDCGAVEGMNASQDLASDLDEARFSQVAHRASVSIWSAVGPGSTTTATGLRRSGLPGRRRRAWWGPRTASTRSQAIHPGAAPAAASRDRRGSTQWNEVAATARSNAPSGKRASSNEATLTSRSASGRARSRNAASVGFGSTPVTAAPSDRSRCVTRPVPGPISKTRVPSRRWQRSRNTSYTLSGYGGRPNVYAAGSCPYSSRPADRPRAVHASSPLKSA